MNEAKNKAEQQGLDKREHVNNNNLVNLHGGPPSKTYGPPPTTKALGPSHKPGPYGPSKGLSNGKAGPSSGKEVMSENIYANVDPGTINFSRNHR